jgi:signal transduction histidine kinase
VDAVLNLGDQNRALEALTNIATGVKRLASALDELIDLAELRTGQRLSLRQVRTVLVALIQGVIADQAIAP